MQYRTIHRDATSITVEFYVNGTIHDADGMTDVRPGDVHIFDHGDTWSFEVIVGD